MDRCTECGATLTPDLEWCGQCYAPVKKEAEAGHEPADGEEPEPWVIEPPEYSAWKAGPYSFGPVGRSVITGIMVALGVVVFFAARAVGKFYGIPGLSLVLMFLGIYSVIAIIVLWGVWRPTRVR
jgi:hypothetical protein